MSQKPDHTAPWAERVQERASALAAERTLTEQEMTIIALRIEGHPVHSIGAVIGWPTKKVSRWLRECQVPAPQRLSGRAAVVVNETLLRDREQSLARMEAHFAVIAERSPAWFRAATEIAHMRYLVSETRRLLS